MSVNRSQKLDIADICDAVAGSAGIGENVSDIAKHANGTSVSLVDSLGLETLEDIRAQLGEIVLHLRKITGEDFE